METIFWLQGIQSKSIDAANLISLYQYEMTVCGDEIKTISQTLPDWCTAGYVSQGSEISKLRIEAHKLIEDIKSIAKQL